MPRILVIGSANVDFVVTVERLPTPGETVSEGTLLVDHGLPHAVPAFPVTVVDTTAAGDAFNGALAVALAERATLSDALKFASAAAALTCTKRGARPSLLSRAEVRRLL